MQKIPEIAARKMPLKEKMKFILLCLFSITVLTGALVFFADVSGTAIIYIIAGADTVYYSWRDVLAFLYLPVIGYFDVLVFLFLFLPFTFRLAKLWGKLSKAIFGYIIIAFILTLPLSLYISFFPLGKYFSCGLRGPLSGAHYVKDLKMCEQFEYHPEDDKPDNTSAPVTSVDKK